MINSICLDQKYSTTRLLIKEKPEIINNPEDKFETVLFAPEGEERKGEGGLRTEGYYKKSYKDKPLISIITVVYNGEKYLEQTIKSVINQTYDNVEYIIIDGGSTDGTIEIIKTYEDKVDYWVSEKDNGIYDAMNKGLTLATGEYIGILNADDYYKIDAIELSINKIKDTHSDYSFANVEYVDTGNIIRPIYPMTKEYIYQEMPYPHVSALIARDIYKNVGLFDTQFEISGDHDMALRIHLKGFIPCYLDKIVASLEAGGISSFSLSNKESLRVALKHNKQVLFAYMEYLLQMSKVLIVKFFPKKVVLYLMSLKGSRFK